jgi:hypothetical protein
MPEVDRTAELRALTERAKRMVAEFAADTDPDWKLAAREITAVLDPIQVVTGVVSKGPDAARVDQALLLAKEVEGLVRDFGGASLARPTQSAQALRSSPPCAAVLPPCYPARRFTRSA